MSSRKTLLRGFSLLELLIVIAILAVLAAILFPVIARAKNQVERTTCAGNLHQLGTSLALYALDFDDYLPDSPSPWAKYTFEQDTDPADAIAFSGPDLRTPLGMYGASNSLWRCPSDQISESARSAWPFASYFQSTGGSYRYDQGAAYVGLSLSSIEQPSVWGLMSDVEAFHGGSPEYWAPGRMGNVLFYDAHLKALPETLMNATVRSLGGILE